MSTIPVHTTPTPFNTRALLDAALTEYTNQTGADLRNHPLAHEIESCDSPDSILAVFKQQAQAFDEFRNGDPRVFKWLGPIIDGLHALSVSAAPGLSLIPPPVNVVFAGIAVLLSTAQQVKASYDALVDIFECIENFLRRLRIYTEIPSTPAMTEVIVKIMLELLRVLALATKQMNQGRFKKYGKKLLGEKVIESVLQRLDRLTLEESRTTAAQTLDVVYGLVNTVQVIMKGGASLTRMIMWVMQKCCSRRREGLDRQHPTDPRRDSRVINQGDQWQEKFRHWLSPPDPWISHNIAREVHHSGTSTWFTQGNIFKKWKSTGPQALLWLHGLPGSGKSVLCSTIIEDIQEICQTGLASLAIFYFDFRDAAKQDARSLLSSLLFQLSHQSHGFSEILSSLYSTHDNGSRQPSVHALMECLKKMLRLPGQGALYLVVDALDECPNYSGYPSPREQVLKIVQELVELCLPDVHFCITSRPEVDIRDVLEPLAIHKVSLHKESGQHQDVVDYINSVVSSDPTMRRWREEDKQLVIKTLTAKVGGMFRWVHCQIETLRRCFPPSIRRTLDELPPTLDGTYEQTLRMIDKEKRSYAHRLFQCLVVSIRPLLVQELAELFAIGPDAESIPTFNSGWRPENPEESVLSACSTLVAIVNVDGNQIVQFSHFSVKEYLTSSRIASSEHVSHFHVPLKPAHTLLSRACLSVLLHLDDRVDEGTIQNFPLASYAAQHWVDHAQFESVSSEIQDGMVSLFDSDKPHFSAWIWVYNMDTNSPELTARPQPPDGVPLYYAAVCGLYDIAECLINAKPNDVDAHGGTHVTPLHAAVEKGHLDIALLLLKHGANVASRDKWDRTPLHVAARYGYIEVARSLINQGADLNAGDEVQETPLHSASRNGRLEIAEILLERGVDANHRNCVDWTPLHVASEYGHDRVTTLLLRHGADANVEDQDSRTPLHIASSSGKIAVVTVLLEYDASIDARDTWGETPLHQAVRWGHLEIVRLLLDHGADVNAHSKHRWAALHLAANNGHLQIVELLLERRGDPHAQNGEGETPFQLASKENYSQVARLLSEHTSV